MAEKQITIKCPRCGGAGNLPQFKHIGGGECFECEGSGRVRAAAVQADPDKVADACGRILMTVGHNAMPAAHDGRWDLVDHRLRSVLDNMFSIGTERAREVLADIKVGRFVCPDTGRLLTRPDLGARVATRLIELGRERVSR